MSCKKTKFIDESTALFYIDKLSKTSKRKTVPIRAYLCEKCLTWHLTSTTDISEQEWLKRYPLEVKELKRINKMQKEKISILSKQVHELQTTIYEYRLQLKKITENLQLCK